MDMPHWSMVQLSVSSLARRGGILSIVPHLLGAELSHGFSSIVHQVLHTVQRRAFFHDEAMERHGGNNCEAKYHGECSQLLERYRIAEVQ
mmetsp:Transcript_19396/g.34054  ORF Transcript_19396/g.34054 Transcript_19396/m.34054 type:complete len:90 (+) Transcript_19396:54-323(+)